MSLGGRAAVGLGLVLGACAASGAAKKSPPNEAAPAVGPTIDALATRPVVVLSGALAAFGAGAHAPKASSAWEMGHWLWSAWPAPTPGDLNWAEAWGLSAETRFLYSVEAPAGPSALRRFTRPNPCGAGVVASAVQHTLWLDPAPNAQRFVEALRWWLTERGWSAVGDTPAEVAAPGRLAALTHPATGARVWVDSRSQALVLRWGGDESLGGRVPDQPLELARRPHDPERAGVSAQVDMPALAALEATMQASGVARACDALRDQAKSVRDEVIAAQLDVASACVRHWTTLADLSTVIDAHWRAEGELAIEVALTPLGRRAWGPATRSVDAPMEPGPTWARLDWAVERGAFMQASDGLAELPSRWATLVETSAACALDASATQAVSALVAAPALLPGAGGELIGALGGVDGSEVSYLSFRAALGERSSEDRVLAVLKSNLPLVPNALWATVASGLTGPERATRGATVNIGDDTLAVHERVEADGVWTTLASGESLPARLTERAPPADARLDARPAPTRWLELVLSTPELARAARRRGLALAYPELTSAGARAPSVTVSAVRADGRIVYRIELSGVGGAGSER